MSLRRLWPGRYTDAHGTQEVTFETDGRSSIRTTIRGVHFQGDSMDGLGAPEGDRLGGGFSFHQGSLCSCLLEWQAPLPVEDEGGRVQAGALHCALRLGEPAGPRGLDTQTLTLTLWLDDRAYRGAGLHGDFEGALNELQRRLPEGLLLRTCIACQWSDYSPLGAGMMAGLACFRDAKDRYREVDGKHGPNGVLAVWDELTEFVQETWHCDRFEHRAAKGYRGLFPDHS